MLCEKYVGRVDLAKAYFKALTSSVNKHFDGNGVIGSMEHCNNFMFLGTEAISLDRVGDDFWCTDLSGDINGTYWLQGCHMVHCEYNSLWTGNFINPDWDMFQSTHPSAEFHAASRAISGGPIYVSDCVGQHDFDLLKRLVLPDGSILRCEYYALPTRDRLFDDPLHNGKTMLKIWNLNKYTGINGAFNCQGRGWSGETRRNQCFSQCVNTITATTNPKDVDWNSGNNPISIDFLEKMEEEGFEPDLVTYNTLVSRYCRRGRLKEAFYLYKIMYWRRVNPDLVTYTSLIKGLCKEGRVREAHQTFHRMVNRGITPDFISYNTLIYAYCKEGKMEQSKRLLHEMLGNSVVPDMFTCKIIVEGFVREGRLLAAVNFVVELTRLRVRISFEVFSFLIESLCWSLQ